MKIRILVVVIFFFFGVCFCMTPDEWRSRTVYQILTDRFAVSGSSNVPSCTDLRSYCGGTYHGISSHLDYLTELGVDSVWISPIVENTDGGFHGYWMKNLHALNSHFGSESDLKSMVEKCHSENIGVMFDIVCNHVGPVDMDFEKITPFNLSQYYHDDCQITDFHNQPQVENCRLDNLPDLAQENNFVTNTFCDWISDTIKTYGFDGVRIDTVPEVPKSFWQKFRQAASSYCLGEVYDGRIDYVAGYQADVLDGVLSYPLFFVLRGVFVNGNSMHDIEGMLQSYRSQFKDLSLLGTFIDNHDQPRFLSLTSDYELYKNALTFLLTAEGIPIIYYGTEQGFSGSGDPNNRESLWPHYDTDHELFKFIKEVIQIRKKYKVALADCVQRYAADNFYAFTRGDVFVAVTNVGSNGPNVTYEITYHPYDEGTKLCNLLNTGDCIVVKSDAFTVTLRHGESKIFVPSS